MASTSIPVTVAHAISFLARPLVVSYPPATLVKLQSVLEANLTAYYAPTWCPQEPSRGSGRRCLTLSPECLPPRVIYSACLASGVQWFDWMKHLGGIEFDLIVDPGCVSVRAGTRISTIWADKPQLRTQSSFRGAQYDESAIQAAIRRQADARAKTLAQQLIEFDHEEDELFSMIADEVNAPTWTTPTVDTFPVSARSTSPLSAISSDSTHSRSSSRSSFSTYSSECSTSPTSSNGEKRMSRRERARQARVYVDTSKTEVTPYDHGKTTVLTGGVMLGGAVPRRH